MMPSSEMVLVTCTLGLYAMGLALSLMALLRDRSALYRAGRAAALLGLLAHTVALGWRWRLSGHLPLTIPYENASLAAWTIMFLTFAAPRRWRLFMVAGLGASALALLLLGWGVMQPSDMTPMAASLKSVWLYVHVFFAIIAFGAYSVASGAALSYLCRQRFGARGWLASLPSLEALDSSIFVYVVFGFITQAVMIAAGGIWAKDLWGAYWSWDPVETWSLVSWLIYGVLIHLRVTYGWRDRRFAAMVAVAVAAVFVAYFGVGTVFSATQHLFTVPV